MPNVPTKLKAEVNHPSDDESDSDRGWQQLCLLEMQISEILAFEKLLLNGHGRVADELESVVGESDVDVVAVDRVTVVCIVEAVVDNNVDDFVVVKMSA